MSRLYLETAELDALLAVSLVFYSLNHFVCLLNSPFFFYLKEVQKFTSLDQLQEFILYHGENIVDMMGDEINRLEKKLSVRR